MDGPGKSWGRGPDGAGSGAFAAGCFSGILGMVAVTAAFLLRGAIVGGAAGAIVMIVLGGLSVRSPRRGAFLQGVLAPMVLLTLIMALNTMGLLLLRRLHP